MNTKKYVQSSDLLIFFFQLLTTGFRTNKLEMTVFEKGFSLEVSNTVRKTFNIIKSMKLIFWFKRSTEKQDSIILQPWQCTDDYHDHDHSKKNQIYLDIPDHGKKLFV